MAQTTSLQIEEIKRQSSIGVIFLTLRNFSIQAVATIGFFILTIVLGTAEVGLFAIVTEVVGIFGYFSDVGLASALIQKKSEVTQKDLRSSFTIQQILVILCLLIIGLTYPSIAFARNFGAKETWILVSLCFSFFAASLKTIPSVLLERRLDFKSISTVDIVENLVFYIVAVVFALMGFGAYSYAIAAFLRSLIGLALMYRIQSWPIGIEINTASLKELFKFGIPFQLNSFIAVAKDRFSSLLVAGIIGSSGFAFISWAQKATRIPLSIMDAVMKVTFPTYSRLQDDSKILKSSIEKTVFYIALLAFPILAGVSITASDFMYIIPKYTKWLPAILPLYLLCANAAIASITTPLTNAFNAVGKIHITTKLMIMWTALTWVFYPLLSIKYGYIGTAYAALIVGSSSFVVWYIASRTFSVNIPRLIFHPASASIIMVLVSLFISTFIPSNYLVSMAVKIIASITIYVIYCFIFVRPQLYWLINQFPWLKPKK